MAAVEYEMNEKVAIITMNEGQEDLVTRVGYT